MTRTLEEVYEQIKLENEYNDNLIYLNKVRQEYLDKMLEKQN